MTKLLLKIHISLILFVVLNYIVSKAFGIGIHSSIIFAVKLLFFLSGIILFFASFKRSRKLFAYSFLYVAYPILIVVIWLSDRLFAGLIAFPILILFNPPERAFKDGDYVIYKKFEYLMAPCCGSYELRENVFYIFQKEIAEISFDTQHSFKKFDKIKGIGYLTITREFYVGSNQQRFSDTTLVVQCR